MGDHATNALDVLALVLIATGVGLLVTDATGHPGVGFIAAGLVILAGSLVATLAGRPSRKEDAE